MWGTLKAKLRLSPAEAVSGAWADICKPPLAKAVVGGYIHDIKNPCSNALISSTAV